MPFANRRPILAINAGSSSLKAALFDPDGSERLLAANAERIGGGLIHEFRHVLIVAIGP